MSLILFEEYIKINLKSAKKRALSSSTNLKRGNLVLESRNINEMLAHIHLTYSHDH